VRPIGSSLETNPIILVER